MSKQLKNQLLIVAFCLSIAGLPVQAAESLSQDIVNLQHGWASASYASSDDTREATLQTLAERAHEVTQQQARSAESLIWEAIILSSYAKAKGGLGALKLAEQARDLLLEAEKKDPAALQGSVYTTLGSLHYKVPGWPIGFGDKKKARAYLEKSLQMNPDGIDPNYFYADFLAAQGDYALAVQHYNKALAAADRAGREDADAGRRAEAKAGLALASSKLR
ncbi:hypothetical protein [Pseudomethylobacillus aquaticus]|uniref:hypothetical protein n=1 Tax=Pseudomethylobacillus aquaticus TaxID=2676064 RepID=UPI00187B67B8|nr:hypothetical protein [Pseudomethylobacillus aquaticus]